MVLKYITMEGVTATIKASGKDALQPQERKSQPENRLESAFWHIRVHDAETTHT
jgi:hypothetical protein